MTFGKSIETCFRKYADFYGRASRSEYWWFMLFGYLCYLVSLVIFPILYVILIFAFLLPQIAVTSRRLHDINKSGWLQLIALIPLVGFIIMIVWCATDGDKKDNRFGKNIYKNTRNKRIKRRR